MYRPEGIICSLVTPFDREEKLIEDGFRDLISYQIEQGVHGIGVAPNTGEFIKTKSAYSFDWDLRFALINLNIS